LEAELKRKNQKNIGTQGVGKFRDLTPEQFRELKELFPSIELERKLKEFDGVLNAKALISYQEVDEVLYKVLNSFKDFADDC
jgi:hypothetical protein